MRKDQDEERTKGRVGNKDMKEKRKRNLRNSFRKNMKTNRREEKF